MESLCTSRGLIGTIPKDQPTHIKGNQLDQVFTNIEVNRWTILEDNITDHFPVLMEIEIHKQKNDLDVRSLPTEIT